MALDLLFALTLGFFLNAQPAAPDFVPASEKQQAISQVVLQLREDGKVVMNAKPFTKEELQQTLTRLVEKFGDDCTCIIRGYDGVSFEEIAAVVEICNQAKITRVAVVKLQD